MSALPPDDEPGPRVPPPSPYGAPPPPPYGSPPPPPYGGPDARQPYPAAPLSPSDERSWAVLAHLSGFLSIVATFVIWAVFRDRGPFVRDQATEALNFQITLAIAGVAFAFITLVTAGFGAILYLAFLAAPVFQILAAVAAGRGEAYRYPLNGRLVR